MKANYTVPVELSVVECLVYFQSVSLHSGLVSVFAQDAVLSQCLWTKKVSQQFQDEAGTEYILALVVVHTPLLFH